MHSAESEHGKVRLRVEVRVTLEYDANLSDYDEATVEEAVRVDQLTAEDDIYLFLDNPDATWEVVVFPAEAQPDA